MVLLTARLIRRLKEKLLEEGFGGGAPAVDINPVPDVPDLVVIDEANTTQEGWFGSGSFVTVLEYTPETDITGVLRFDMGADFAAEEAGTDGEFYIFPAEVDPRTDGNATELVDVWKNNPTADFSLLAWTTYYLVWVDWDAEVGRTIDRGPIRQTLLTAELGGIMRDDKVIGRVQEDGTLAWEKAPPLGGGTPGPQGPQGPQGPTGNPGDPGDPPHVPVTVDESAPSNPEVNDLWFTLPVGHNFFGTTSPGFTSGGSPALLGTRFTTDTPGNVTAIRFHKASDNVPSDNGWDSRGLYLWNADTETLLGSIDSDGSAETAGSNGALGWQEMLFAEPIAVVPGTVYQAVVHIPSGHWSQGNNTVNYFENPVTVGPLTAPASGEGNINGTYHVLTNGEDTSLVMPTVGSAWPGVNYFVDVVLETPATTKRWDGSEWQPYP